MIVLLLLGSGSGAGAQSPLNGFIPYTHEMTALKARLRLRVVTIAAPQNLGPGTFPQPVAYGFGVVITIPTFKGLTQRPNAPRRVLVTALRLVEKASKISVKTPDGSAFQARLATADPQQALAYLTIADSRFWTRVRATELAPPAMVKAQTLVFVVTPLPNNDAAIAWGRLVSTELRTPLAGYWGTDVAIINGLPLFSRDEKLVAINFRYGYGTAKMGFSAAVGRISDFLKLLVRKLPQKPTSR